MKRERERGGREEESEDRKNGGKGGNGKAT